MSPHEREPSTEPQHKYTEKRYSGTPELCAWQQADKCCSPPLCRTLSNRYIGLAGRAGWPIWNSPQSGKRSQSGFRLNLASAIHRTIWQSGIWTNLVCGPIGNEVQSGKFVQSGFGCNLVNRDLGPIGQIIQSGNSCNLVSHANSNKKLINMTMPDNAWRRKSKSAQLPDWTQNLMGYFLPDWIQSGTGPHVRLLIPIWVNRAIWTRLEPDCFDSGRIKQNTTMENN